MSIISSGYDGSVNEVKWAVMASMLGGPWGSFADLFSFQVVIGGAGARAVTVGAGTAFGDGVTDQNTAPIVANAAALSSGTVRWDTVVIRRVWATNTSSVVIVPGTATQGITTGTRNPGVQSDQPLALIKITASADVQQVIDVRAFERKPADGWCEPNTNTGIWPYYNSWWYDQATQHWWHVDTSDPITGGGNWVNKTVPARIALPLAGSAGILVPFNVAPTYRRANGRVQFNGTVKRATGFLVSSGGVTDVIVNTQLPSGYRPAQTATFVLPEIGGSDFCRGVVDTNGVLSILTDGKDISGISLDAINYIADGS